MCCCVRTHITQTHCTQYKQSRDDETETFDARKSFRWLRQTVIIWFGVICVQECTPPSGGGSGGIRQKKCICAFALALSRRSLGIYIAYI